MTTQVNIHDAKTHLSRLLEAVERGEEVIIARAGRPIATLSAYRPPLRRTFLPPGSLQGTDWTMSDNFDDPIDDLFDIFKSEEEIPYDDTPVNRQ